MPTEFSEPELIVLKKVFEHANLPEFIADQVLEDEMTRDDLKSLNTLLVKLQMEEIVVEDDKEEEDDEDDEDTEKDEDNE